MKVVVLRIENRKVTVLSNNGKFMHIPYRSGMKVGTRVDMPNPFRYRLPKMFNIAACLTAFAFALLYLLFYIKLIN